VGFVPFTPTHLRNEGVVKETQGFIGAKKLLGEGKESETNFGGETFVRAKVGWGDGIKGGSLRAAAAEPLFLSLTSLLGFI
jgi:hypothetical protein